MCTAFCVRKLYRLVALEQKSGRGLRFTSAVAVFALCSSRIHAGAGVHAVCRVDRYMGHKYCSLFEAGSQLSLADKSAYLWLMITFVAPCAGFVQLLPSFVYALHPFALLPVLRHKCMQSCGGSRPGVHACITCTLQSGSTKCAAVASAQPYHE